MVVPMLRTHLVTVRLRCAALMDILEQIEEWAQEHYPDSVLLQEKFKEGAIRSLEVITLAAAYAALEDKEV